LEAQKMAKKKPAETPKDAADLPEGLKTMTKTEAVKQAIAAGLDKPKEAVAYIKEKFGLDVGAQMFSSYKSQLNRKGGAAPAKRGRKAGVSKGTETHGLKGYGTSGVELAREVKKLVDGFGAVAVKEMADVFAG
jgi:hypothetical protein